MSSACDDGPLYFLHLLGFRSLFNVAVNCHATQNKKDCTASRHVYVKYVSGGYLLLFPPLF
jgi:hypothetical protein